MASRFLQKYYLPEGFQEIMSELVREVLRNQPDDIIEFLANYCEARAAGKEYQYAGLYNVKKQEIPQPPSKEQYQDITNKAKQLVMRSNKQEQIMEPRKKEGPTNQLEQLPEPLCYSEQDTLQSKIHQEQQQQMEKKKNIQLQSQQKEIQAKDKSGNKSPAQQQMNFQQQLQKQQETQMNINKQKETQTHQRVISAKSQKSVGGVSNATSHPEEKGITREFVGELYDSALKSVKKESVEKEEIHVQGDVQASFEFNSEQNEEYEQAARYIQGKYRELKQQK